MRTASHNAVVLDQYNTRASAYVNSAVHAAGEDLDLIAQIVANQRGAVALDVGCGGDTSRTASPHSSARSWPAT